MIPKFPNSVFMITDDEDAITIITQLGFLDKFSDPRRQPGGRIAFYKHYNHPTHWILAGRFHGSERKEDDGFILSGWPKANFDREVLDQEVKRFIDDNEGREISRTDVPEKPPSN